jgi:hypothetical protein
MVLISNFRRFFMEAVNLNQFKIKDYSAGLAAYVVLCSAVLGLQPSFLSLQTFLVIGSMFLLKAPVLLIGALTAVFYLLGALFVDTLSSSIGAMILGIEALSPMWALMSELPIVPLTRFNNTVFMGSVFLALDFAVITYIVYMVKSKKEGQK